MAADTETHDDRREHVRTDVDLAVKITADGTTVDARTINLSEGGILMAGADFPSSAQVRVEIELAELGWHALEAEVVRRGEGDDGREALAARFAEAATLGGREAIRRFFLGRVA